MFAAAAVAGCDAQEDADRENGRNLFIEKCGTCHTLAEAATTANVGPDLDAAFADARAVGMDEDTIEGVTQTQISNPREVDPELTNQYMPAEPRRRPGRGGRRRIRRRRSPACPGSRRPRRPAGPAARSSPTTAAAPATPSPPPRARGNVGPNLDEVIPGQDAAMVEESIVDPEAEPSQGFPAGVMPQDYEAQIPPEDLKLLVEFLIDNAGKSGESG